MSAASNCGLSALQLGPAANDRKDYPSAGEITADLVAHVQTEHARGVQNHRSVAILKAARDLQRICADRE